VVFHDKSAFDVRRPKMERFVQYLPPANFFGCLFLSQSSWCYRITGMTEFLKMHPAKAEFKRLIELMGWSQTEAGRRLRKTPTRPTLHPTQDFAHQACPLARGNLD
jgi:hypothetical protein